MADVGANWGLHTLYLSRLVGADGKVFAFEPYPPAFAELEWHIQANGCNNVVALPIALSDCHGTASFQVGHSSSVGFLTQGEAKQTSKEQILQVQAHRLDELCNSLSVSRLNFVKIDVEGAEERVLLGAAQVTERCAPIYVVELHNPTQDVQVAQWFTNRRYRLERLSKPDITRTDLGWPHQEGVWGTILARPKRSE